MSELQKWPLEFTAHSLSHSSQLTHSLTLGSSNQTLPAGEGLAWAITAQVPGIPTPAGPFTKDLSPWKSSLCWSLLPEQ